MSVSGKIDGGQVGLRYVEGIAGALPGSPVWKELKVNEYGDVGSTISTVARNPISPSRQQEKGVISDLEAAMNFTLDMTQDNLYDLFQGTFFAAWRSKTIFGGAGEVTGVTSSTFTAASGLTAFTTNDIVAAKGFSNSANNGRHIVTSAASGVLTVGSTLVAEASPPATAKLYKVGCRGASGDFTIDVAGAYPALLSTTKDFTTLGLIPGQWVYIGGDSAASQFANATANGYARIKTVAAHKIEFDKTQYTMVADTGTGKTIELYIPHLIKNESDPSLILTKEYFFERSLGSAGYQYIDRAVVNTLNLNINAQDKITAEFGFVALDEVDTAFGSRRSGTFPASTDSIVGYNTSSDLPRIRMATHGALQTPIAAFVTEMSMSINNNVTALKVLGNLGGIDFNVGDFTVETSATIVFTDKNTLDAVRQNADVSLDFIISRDNTSWVVDQPLVTLSDGKLSVAKAESITQAFTIQGARHSTLDTTLVMCFFPYLPDVAES